MALRKHGRSTLRSVLALAVMVVWWYEQPRVFAAPKAPPTRTPRPWWWNLPKDGQPSIKSKIMEAFSGISPKDIANQPLDQILELLKLKNEQAIMYLPRGLDAAEKLHWIFVGWNLKWLSQLSPRTHMGLDWQRVSQRVSQADGGRQM